MMESLQSSQKKRMFKADLKDENNNVVISQGAEQLKRKDSMQKLIDYQRKLDQEEPDEELVNLHHKLTKDIESDTECEDHISPLDNWLKVPQTVKFVNSVVDGMYEAKIKIENKSKWDMTYFVHSSNTKKFRVDRKIGSIPPKDRVEVMILSRLSQNQDFGDISSEGFAVLAAPIYYKSQLQNKKLNLLWKAYGTKLFPYDAAENHKIEFIIPADDSFYGGCLLAKAGLGNFVAKQPLPHVREWANSWDDDDEPILLENLAPTESDHTIGIIQRQQIREWKQSIRILRDKFHHFIENVQIFAGILLSFGAVWLGFQFYMHFLDPIYAEPEPPRPWYRYFF